MIIKSPDIFLLQNVSTMTESTVCNHPNGVHTPGKGCQLPRVFCTLQNDNSHTLKIIAHMESYPIRQVQAGPVGSQEVQGCDSLLLRVAGNRGYVHSGIPLLEQHRTKHVKD